MLDPVSRRELMGVIRDLHSAGKTIILITHHSDEAVDADRIILRRPTEKCIFCQSEAEVENTMGRPVCKKCMEKLKSQ
jgi:ABC-type multidrug transport system ATPase subunit